MQQTDTRSDTNTNWYQIGYKHKLIPDRMQTDTRSDYPTTEKFGKIIAYCNTICCFNGWDYCYFIYKTKNYEKNNELLNRPQGCVGLHVSTFRVPVCFNPGLKSLYVDSWFLGGPVGNV